MSRPPPRLNSPVLGGADHHEQPRAVEVGAAELPERAADRVDHPGGHVDRAEPAVRGVVRRAELACEEAGQRLHLVAAGEQRKALGVGGTQLREPGVQQREGLVPGRLDEVVGAAFAARSAHPCSAGGSGCRRCSGLRRRAGGRGCRSGTRTCSRWSCGPRCRVRAAARQAGRGWVGRSSTKEVAVVQCRQTRRPAACCVSARGASTTARGKRSTRILRQRAIACMRLRSRNGFGVSFARRYLTRRCPGTSRAARAGARRCRRWSASADAAGRQRRARAAWRACR